MREVRTPVSIPIKMLYDEIIRQCQEKKAIRAKDELDVILNKIFVCNFNDNFIYISFFGSSIKYLKLSFKECTRLNHTVDEIKTLQPFEIKTKKIIENDGVSFCFEVSYFDWLLE